MNLGACNKGHCLPGLPEYSSVLCIDLIIRFIYTLLTSVYESHSHSNVFFLQGDCIQEEVLRWLRIL